LHRKKKFDVIVIYGTNVPGLAGVVLKWLTGAKLIAELPNVPENSYRFDKPNPGIWDAAKRWLADLLLNFVGTSADCLKLLYPWQLEKYRRLQGKNTAIFHDFVPVHTIKAIESEERSVLLVGYPWHTKGVDVLIRAFKKIATQFPDYKLKLMGYYPDRKYLDRLAADCSQIEFLRARPNDLALHVIGACSVYVSASRTESMGRVLLEAMAARKPIIASRVGGVPYVIADNDNGLLFEPGNVNDLADKLSLLLRNPELCERLGTRAYERVMTEFDEDEYVRLFEAMLQKLDSEEPAVCADRARPQSREV
jgi:glycosyltransferase involved in cell wall biosynthesis